MDKIEGFFNYMQSDEFQWDNKEDLSLLKEFLTSSFVDDTYKQATKLYIKMRKK